MHGDSDYTVRVDQSVEMYDKLKAAGKQVEFIRFSGDEDHYLERAETRIRMLHEIEKFLAQHQWDDARMVRQTHVIVARDHGHPLSIGGA